MRSRIDLRCNSIKKELQGLSQNYQMEIRKREKFLLDRLDVIRMRKVGVLDTQCADLTVAQTSMKTMTEQLTLCSTNGHEMKLIKTTNDAMESFKGQFCIFKKPITVHSTLFEGYLGEI